MIPCASDIKDGLDYQLTSFTLSRLNIPTILTWELFFYLVSRQSLSSWSSVGSGIDHVDDLFSFSFRENSASTKPKPSLIPSAKIMSSSEGW